MKKYYILLLIIGIIFCILLINTCILNEQEKNLLACLDKIDQIYYKAAETRNVVPDSCWGHPVPQEAVNIVNNAIKEIENLVIPEKCNRFFNLSNEALNLLKSFHMVRINSEDSQAMESKLTEIVLEIVNLEVQRTEEYYRIVYEEIGGLKVKIYRLLKQKMLWEL